MDNYEESAFNSSIRCSKSQFYGFWSLLRPPASVGVNPKNCIILVLMARPKSRHVLKVIMLVSVKMWKFWLALFGFILLFAAISVHLFTTIYHCIISCDFERFENENSGLLDTSLYECFVTDSRCLIIFINLLTPTLAILHIAYASGGSMWRSLSFNLPYWDFFCYLHLEWPWIGLTKQRHPMVFTQTTRKYNISKVFLNLKYVKKNIRILIRSNKNVQCWWNGIFNLQRLFKWNPECFLVPNRYKFWCLRQCRKSFCRNVYIIYNWKLSRHNFSSLSFQCRKGNVKKSYVLTCSRKKCTSNWAYLRVLSGLPYILFCTCTWQCFSSVLWLLVS